MNMFSSLTERFSTLEAEDKKMMLDFLLTSFVTCEVFSEKVQDNALSHVLKKTAHDLDFMYFDLLENMLPDERYFHSANKGDAHEITF